MSKVRVVMAEYEGSDTGLLEVIRSFVPAASAMAPVALAAPVEVSRLAALPAPVEVSVPAATPRRQVKRQTGRKKVTEAASKPTESAEAPVFNAGGSNDTIMRMLKARPMTSGELIKASGLTAPTVYTALSMMRERGFIETREDPADAQKKNYWK